MSPVKNKQGYIALSTVLIVSSVVLAISVMTTLLSIGSAQSSLALNKAESSLGFTEGCAEDGMLKSQASIGYTGGTITRPEGTCQISMTKNGTVWTMTTETVDVKYKTTILVTFSRTPTKITLISWKEI